MLGTNHSGYGKGLQTDHAGCEIEIILPAALAELTQYDDTGIITFTAAFNVKVQNYTSGVHTTGQQDDLPRKFDTVKKQSMKYACRTYNKHLFQKGGTGILIIRNQSNEA